MDESKKKIGTVEGVALILSVLACLILFFKIMPNMNANLEFYNEKIHEIDRQLSDIQVKVENLQRSSVKSKHEIEVRQLQDMVNGLDGLTAHLPEQYREGLSRASQEISSLLNEMHAK